MLSLPVLSDQDYTCRLLGIDNGSTLLGFTILDYDIRTRLSKLVHCETYKIPNNYRETREAYYNDRGALPTRIRMIEDYYYDLLDEYQPDIVGCESPFAHLHVNSYRVLTLTMQALDDVTYRYDRSLEFYKIAPSEAKSAALVGRKFDSAKTAVHDGVMDHPYLINTNCMDLRDLGPDALDSIAVALALTSKVII